MEAAGSVVTTVTIQHAKGNIPTVVILLMIRNRAINVAQALQLAKGHHYIEAILNPLMPEVL
jgi:hypothetical protein